MSAVSIGTNTYKSVTDTKRAGRQAKSTGDGGFALVVVLLVMIGLSGLAAAGYVAATTDYQITQNHRASERAFYVTDASLEEHLGRGSVAPDTQTYSHADGSGDVWTEQLLEVDDETFLYLVSAEGRHTPPEGGASARRFRTVALLDITPFNVKAAITAPAGFHKNGASGTVDGHDASTPSDCPTGGTDDVAGLQVPPAGLSGSGGGSGGGGGKGGGKGGGGGGSTGWVDGVPAIDSTAVATQMLQDLGIPWSGVLDGSFVQADYVVSQDGYPNLAQLSAAEWPIVLVDQSSFSMNPGHSGKGTLVVQGDLTFNGKVEWDGLMLIGGEMTSNGNQIIEGAVVTGLNLLLGQYPNATNLGNGTMAYRYHSCNVVNALKSFAALVEEPGTWFEEF